MDSQVASVAHLFPHPRTPQEALTQANVLHRAQTLFQSGYDFYIADQDAYRFGICGSQGEHYEVNVRALTCSCKCFQERTYCKHLVGLILCREAQEASQVKALELQHKDADVLLSDRIDRIVREAGGGF